MYIEKHGSYVHYDEQKMEDEEILRNFDNHLLNRKSNFSSIVEICCYGNQKEQIHHSADGFFPIGIRFDKFYDIETITHFEVYYTYNRLLSIPIKLLMRLSCVYSDDEYYYIDIRPDLFFRLGEGIFYFDPYYQYHICLVGKENISYKANILLHFRKKKVHSENLISSYHEYVTYNGKMYMSSSLTNCPGFFVETGESIENIRITTEGGSSLIQEYSKFIVNTFKIKTYVWNDSDKYNIKKFISESTCVDVANIIFSYISCVYLYYIPFDTVNGRYDSFHKETVLYDGHDILIDFEKNIRATLTFVSINKVTKHDSLIHLNRVSDRKESDHTQSVVLESLR